ncbi:MAG: hypothetical protein R3E39_23230 [Anaerolineae bacterium]
MPSIPTITDIERIARLADPVLRNLLITQSYHELALAFAARTGLSANWCTFATWASKQAGQTIRKEDVARTLEHIMQTSATAQAEADIVTSAQTLGSDQSAFTIQAALGDVFNPVAAFARASDAVGRGNKKVFEEIGYEFARFIATCLQDTRYDEINLASFCDPLRLGPPPDGQQYLRQAFTRYYQAFFESDPKTRAELLLYANIEIGTHEQTRLQPEIAAALDSAFLDANEYRQRLIHTLFPNKAWLVRLRLFVLKLLNRPSPFDTALNILINEARRQAHLLITEYMMTITIPPDLRLRLGHDVPADFPTNLQHINLPDLREFLQRFDPTPDSPHGSGAVDWSNLLDRLHFIVDLFRCYHETPALFDPPFAPDQIDALLAGRIPQGRL